VTLCSRDTTWFAVPRATRAASQVALVALSLVLRTTSASAQPTAPPSRVQAGSLVRPDTVEIGDPFVFIVSVAVPQTARVEWAAITDTAATVAMKGAIRVIDEGTKLGLHRERAEYTLTAWNVGSLLLGVPDATVRLGNTTTKVPLAEARVFVKSVLPADTARRVPKPARALFQREVPWWQQWWPALLILAALAALWWYLRRRRRTKPARSVVSVLDAYVRAVLEFERLERLQLADAGESGRYVALATDVLRMYLAERSANAVLSLTSRELMVVALEDVRVPHDRLLSLLDAVDGVKFAARQLSPTRARELVADTRAVVEAIEAAEKARRAAEDARRQAAEAADARERQHAEDRAREESRRPKAGAR